MSHRGPEDATAAIEKRTKPQSDAEWQRATFIVRVDHLDKLKDYAYTERISQKEALDEALCYFLQDKENLLSHK